MATILLTALPQRRPGDDMTVLRLGLALGAWHLAVLVATACPLADQC